MGLGRYPNYSVFTFHHHALRPDHWCVPILFFSASLVYFPLGPIHPSPTPTLLEGASIRNADPNYSILKVTANEDLTLSNPYATEAALLSAYISTEKASYGSSVIYPLACAFPKLSVAALYLRLFPPSGPSRIMRLGRRASWWIIVFLVANCIAFFIPSTAACLPPSAYWTYPAQLQKCLNLTALGTWISFPHILSDIVMLLIPLPLVWRLQVSLRKKLGLTVIFLAGGL